MEEFQLQNRRDFLRYMFGASFVLAGFSALPADMLQRKGVKKLTILYTNDQHSRIEPFPSNDPKYPDQGGFARRAALIKKIRSEEKNILLLDAGDIFQGTPYFNYYAGELEYKLMSQMGYDAVTLGNHDFDLGLDNISKQMPHANFSFVCANYDFSNTSLNEKILPYKIFVKDGIKVGVFGLGIELAGLVDKKNYGETKYLDPIKKGQETAAILKKEKGCDYVICLSHLGYDYPVKKISDKDLSAGTSHIDLIIGGHTHTFLEEPKVLSNQDKKNVQVTQVGWAGIWLGRIDVYFGFDNKQQTSVAGISTIDANTSIG
jgi:5'-nucleotidase